MAAPRRQVRRRVRTMQPAVRRQDLPFGHRFNEADNLLSINNEPSVRKWPEKEKSAAVHVGYQLLGGGAQASRLNRPMINRTSLTHDCLRDRPSTLVLKRCG